MTNKVEKQFFETFGIEPKEKFYCLKGYCNQNPSVKTDSPKCRECENGNYYTCPEITNRILLELILINMHNEDLFGYPNNIQELKDNTLKQLIETYNKFSTCVTCDGEYQQSARDIKHQIHTLFKEKK